MSTGGKFSPTPKTRGMNPKKKESVPSIMPMGPDKAPMKSADETLWPEA